MLESVKFVRCGEFISQGKWIHPKRVMWSHEIIFVIRGEVCINENGTEYILRKNDILHLEPNLLHFGFRESEDTSFYWLHWINHPTVPMNKLFSIDNPYSISLLFNQLLHYSADSRFPENPDYVTRLILSELYAAPQIASESRLVNRAAEWIRSNSHSPIKASDVAEYLECNTDYLSRLFRKQYGKNLKQFIDFNRMEYIKKQLLNCEQSSKHGSRITPGALKEIASECGFEDYKAFLKYFKYHEKMTPTEFCSIYTKTHINHQ